MLPDTHLAEQHQEEHGERSTAFVPQDGATHAEIVTGTDSSGPKRREPKPRQEKDHLGRIVDLIQQSIVVLNPHGKAIYANRAVLEYTGLTLNEVCADDSRDRVFHPEDIQRLGEERQKALSGMVPFENEQRVRGKEGKYRWFLVRYNPLLDEAGTVV